MYICSVKLTLHGVSPVKNHMGAEAARELKRETQDDKRDGNKLLWY